jgi:hypothetical protein
MSEAEAEEVLSGVKDASLRHTLQFGIGLHHAGLNERDRTLVERLYVECKIQVMMIVCCMHRLCVHSNLVCGAITRRGASHRMMQCEVQAIGGTA